MINFRVESAENGDVYKVALDRSEGFSLDNFRKILSTFSGIPSADQILLVGPPFKKLDSLFSPDIQPNADTRIFLYNRRSITDPNFTFPPVLLRPTAPPEVEPLGEQSEASKYLLQPGLAVSPLVKTLPVFEREFLSQFHRGISLHSFVEGSAITARKSIAQYQVQRDAVKAVLSNIKDLFDGSSLSFAVIENKISQQQILNLELLNSFDKNLFKLSGITVHYSLATAIRAYIEKQQKSQSQLQASSSVSALLSISVSSEEFTRNESSATTATSSSEVRVNLLDCVVVDKEKAWAEKCSSLYQLVENDRAEVNLLHNEIKASVVELERIVREDGMDKSSSYAEAIETIEAILPPQKADLDQLKDSHMTVFEEVERRCKICKGVSTLEDSINADDGLAQQIDGFDKQRLLQETMLHGMESRVLECARAKDNVAELRSQYLPVIQRILSRVVEVQTMLHKFKQRVELMKKVSTGHNEYFVHLRSIVDLPVTYQAFLLEIVRRREFSAVYSEAIGELDSQITALRDSETLQRAAFMRVYGNDIPPILSSVVPSIKHKPPFITLTSSGEQWLPEVTESDLDAESLQAVRQQNQHLSSCFGKKAYDELSLEYSRRMALLMEENLKLKNEIEALSQKTDVRVDAAPERPVPHGQDNIALASAMSALSSVVEMVSQHSISSTSSTFLPGKGFLTSEKNLGADAELVVGMVRQFITGVDQQIKVFKDQVTSAEETVDAALSSSVSQGPSVSTVDVHAGQTEDKIAMHSFSIGDVALFFPTNTQGIYIALNTGRFRHRYLDPESLQAHKDAVASKPRGRTNILNHIILGRIICMTPHVAAEGNPYDLQAGTEYFLLTVTPIV